MLTAGQVAHKLIGKAGRREGGGGADPQSGEGGLGPGDGLARRGGLVRCRGRVCWANAELCAQCVGCSCKAVQGSRGCGACWAGERLRRAVRGLVGREPRCDMRSWLWRASAGCRGEGSGLHVQCGCGIMRSRPFSVFQFVSFTRMLNARAPPGSYCTVYSYSRVFRSRARSGSRRPGSGLGAVRSRASGSQARLHGWPLSRLNVKAIRCAPSRGRAHTKVTAARGRAASRSLRPRPRHCRRAAALCRIL